MPIDGFTRRSSSERDIQPVAIHAVNAQERSCEVLTRVGTMITVDCSFATGDTIVVPAVGEQWYIERFDQAWRLYGRIPFNDPTLLIEPVEGQVSVGSGRGPVELNGDEVRINGFMKLGETLYRDVDGDLEYSPNGGDTWIPVVPPAGVGAPGSTDEVPEGITNLYFTTARAAAAAPVTSVAGRTGAITLTKTDVGLNNVDNTSDSAKPLSSAASAALSNKADLVSGTVPLDQLPPEYDEVQQYDDISEFPIPGEAGKLYIADDSGNLYRWGGVSYAIMVTGSGTLDSTDDLPEGATNKYYTDVRAAAAAPVQDDDPRLDDERVPLDDSVTLAKLDEEVLDALEASPYDVSYPQTGGLRAVGYGQASIGVKLQRAVTFTKVHYRCGTADVSGNSTFEIRKNGSAVSGTSKTIAAASQVAGDYATGTWSFAEGDILTVYTTAVGSTPGIGLVADLKGNA